jgi:hypothetical protein
VYIEQLLLCENYSIKTTNVYLSKDAHLIRGVIICLAFIALYIYSIKQKF